MTQRWPLLVDAETAAAALHTSPAGLARLVADGRLRPVRLFPDEPPQFRPEDLLELVEDAASVSRGARVDA